jgi:imidazole glycerol-phosphate synthase subunit HisH
MTVGIIDYGTGNIGSVFRALQELKASPELIQRPADMSRCDALILPGVGNFSDCASLLAAGGWTGALREEVLGNERPLLGICVGMQLLADFSMEGSDSTDLKGTPGLGLIPGSVDHLRTFGCRERVPHVGWNSITQAGQCDDLLANIPDGTDFYFVHSFAFMPDEASDVLATTQYDVSFTSAVHRGNIWGTQFHPEKSSKAGFQLLQNFISTSRC